MFTEWIYINCFVGNLSIFNKKALIQALFCFKKMPFGVKNGYYKLDNPEQGTLTALVYWDCTSLVGWSPMVFLCQWYFC